MESTRICSAIRGGCSFSLHSRGLTASQGVLQGSSLFAEIQSDRVQEQQQDHVVAQV